jgi:hypothetical protein
MDKRKQMTHSEGGYFYAVITTKEGFTYYSGAFKSRSAAYRYAVKMNKHWN